MAVSTIDHPFRLRSRRAGGLRWPPGIRGPLVCLCHDRKGVGAPIGALLVGESYGGLNMAISPVDLAMFGWQNAGSCADSRLFVSKTN